MWLVVLHCFRHRVGCGQVLLPDITKLKTAAPDSCLLTLDVTFSDAGGNTECFARLDGVAAQFVIYFMSRKIYAAHPQCVSNFMSTVKCAFFLWFRFPIREHHTRLFAGHLQFCRFEHSQSAFKKKKKTYTIMINEKSLLLIIPRNDKKHNTHKYTSMYFLSLS